MTKSKTYDIAVREFARLKKWTEDLTGRTFAARDNGDFDKHFEQYADEFLRLDADYRRLCAALGFDHD